MNNHEIKKQLIVARDEYINLIKAELMGPGSEFGLPDFEHELISSSPLSRYSVGILFPQGNKNGQDNDETDIKVEDWQNNFSEIQVADEPGAREKIINNIPQFDETASENLDEEIGMAAQYKPSSMGVTFLIRGKAEVVYCNVSFATYRRTHLSDCVIPYEPEKIESFSVPTELADIIKFDKGTKSICLLRGCDIKEINDRFVHNSLSEKEARILKNSIFRLNNFLNVGYIREPHSIKDIKIIFGKSDFSDNTALDGTNAKLVALRTQISDKIYSLTVMLVNNNTSSPAKVNECLFQSMIEISSTNNEFSFIESNPNPNPEYMDEEEKTLEMLYRNKKIFATGLGTSVDWDISKEGLGRLWTDFFPIREIPAMNFSLPKNNRIHDEELSMKYLSDLGWSNREEKIDSMTRLVNLYSEWITNLEKTAVSLDPRYEASASKNILICKRAAKRMYEGIKTLRDNDNAYYAFLLANRAMFIQRIHLQKQSSLFKNNSDRYPDDEEISQWLRNLNYTKENDEACRWRPFQIAFLLMDINSIVFDKGEDRSIVDLIWFPTGGGKTEAYLGLTAFAIFYNKLAYPEQSGGTIVMMRYTLRLLAAQQFTRAATLICACEYIRQDSMQRNPQYPSYQLGKKPITIGLWIGGSHIPNNNTSGENSAKEHLLKLKDAKANTVRSDKERHNKFQVLKCPWCGTKLVKDEKDGNLIGAWGYHMRNEKHFYMACTHEDCNFTDCLPIQIIDEELYDNPPTLLFGTVDKFAMMAWDGRVGAFFGLHDDNRAPELIIQDELHLISGALGTIVGLYETAIDGLSSMKGIKPKIIASTATIRRAKEQCSVLYNREVIQFPAAGLNAEDSFFAKEDVIDYSSGKYGRKYVGIMPSGRTKAMTEVRAMAALLQKAYTLQLADEIKDKLWTLTVYFNSLKDLGKASTLVDDDVKDFIIRTANRMFTLRRHIKNADELTSRVSTTALNETLDKLEKIEYSKENREAKKYASDILLATNMISVGIDVARLNVMLMIGQPKLTSEYIQASSRIGRSFPGIAFVQYDATKSRDRSHYERFRAYHDSFYRFVEPTGATPFSKPARERALHAVITTLLRHKKSLIEDKDADFFDIEAFKQAICETKTYVIERIKSINDRAPTGNKDDIYEIENEMQEFFEFWQDVIDSAHNENRNPVCFGKQYMIKSLPKGVRRLFKQYNSSGKDDAKETLTSMRNVDVSVYGRVIIWEDQNV